MSNATSSGSRRGGRRGNISQEAVAGGSGAGDGPPAAAAAAAVATSRNDDDPDDLGGEGSNNGSTTTEGGGGSADEPGSRKAKRRRLSGNTQPLHPTQADSDRWFTNTHIAMVVILAKLFTELQERHLKSNDEEVMDKDEDEAVLGYMQRIKDIGQEANAFTKSRVQTHLLISNTVQLCHRMAGDKYCKLAQDYPPEDTSDFDYDFTTDFESDDEDHDMRGSSRGGGASAGGAAKRGDSGGAGSNGNSGGVSNGKAKQREGVGKGYTGVSGEQWRGSVRTRSVGVTSSVESVSWTRACARIVLGRLAQSSSRSVVDRHHRGCKLIDRALSDDNEIDLGISEVGSTSRCYP